MDSRNWRKSADDLYNELQREKRRSERLEVQNAMYRDTLNYIAGNSHLTTDTLQEARDAANGVLEEAGA